MSRYRAGTGRSRVPRRIVWVLVALFAVCIIAVVFVRQAYDNGLKPVSTNQTTQIFTVEKGSSVKEIGAKLEDEKLIRSAWAFQLYIHSKELGNKLQAGTYALAPSQDVPEIVTTLTRGEVTVKLVTILPGRRIDQVRADFINAGFAPESVDLALDPAQYGDLPALAYKPAEVTTLEGLLWPDSYQKQPDTDPATIIRQSLEDMGEKLTPDVQAAFAAQGLTTYQGLILTSMITQELSKPADQAQAAQVFLSRLKIDMSLGSDPTAKYGAILAGRAPDLTYDSPYNTLMRKGLPPTPISTITASALTAATNPAATDWLYFVSGDDGTTHFSRTLAEHEALTAQYCHELCGN